MGETKSLKLARGILQALNLCIPHNVYGALPQAIKEGRKSTNKQKPVASNTKV